MGLHLWDGHMVRIEFVNINSLLNILQNYRSWQNLGQNNRQTKLEYTTHEPSNGRTASSSGTRLCRRV